MKRSIFKYISGLFIFILVTFFLSLIFNIKINEKYASLYPLTEVSERDIQININSKLQDPELKRLLSLDAGEVSRETIYEKYQNLSEEELSRLIEDNPLGPFTLVNNYNWANDFSISYLSVTPIFYDGYIEHDMDLVFAEHSDNGDVLYELSENDGEIVEMISRSDITLKFTVPETPVQPGWVRQYMLVTNGRYEESEVEYMLAGMPHGGEQSELPTEYKLHQNYPNPFNPVTTIKFDMPKEGQVNLKVFDITGREIYTFNDHRKAGYHSITFNGTGMASGVYFYRIQSGHFVETKRMLLIK